MDLRGATYLIVCTHHARSPFTLDRGLARSLGAWEDGPEGSTYSEARQNLATLLEEARRKGGVRIRRRDGESFVLRPERPVRSPFDVQGAGLGLGREQILRAIHESRKK